PEHRPICPISKIRSPDAHDHAQALSTARQIRIAARILAQNAFAAMEMLEVHPAEITSGLGSADHPVGEGARDQRHQQDDERHRAKAVYHSGESTVGPKIFCNATTRGGNQRKADQLV
ncbi:MAG: hypothetical protein ACOH2J_15520, partial [Allorhizobium sp.]